MGAQKLNLETSKQELKTRREEIRLKRDELQARVIEIGISKVDARLAQLIDRSFEYQTTLDGRIFDILGNPECSAALVGIITKQIDIVGNLLDNAMKLADKVVTFHTT